MLLCCCHQARTIWFYCTDIVYQLDLKSVLFRILMECITLVNEMLLMISGDIEPNPGPGEYLSTITPNSLNVHSTHMTIGNHTGFVTDIGQFMNPAMGT